MKKTADDVCEGVTNYTYDALQEQQVKSNLNENEWKAPIEINVDVNFPMKKADKGNAVVIIDIDYYKNLLLKMLENNNNYERQYSTTQSKQLISYSPYSTNIENALLKNKLTFYRISNKKQVYCTN